MSSALREAVLEALSTIRAVQIDDLRSAADPNDDPTEISSPELVAILVLVRNVSGLDPGSREVLRACDQIRTVGQLVRFATASAVRAA